MEEGDSLARSILRVYAQTGETFVLLLDEYDVLVREDVSKELFDEYLSFLNGLFKSDTLRPAICLAYMTGILPIVRDRIQSKLNNFEEYTIMDAMELAEFVGFTSEEVKDLCDKHGVDFEECRVWYDGYSQNGYEIYNPESVVKCIRRKRFQSYWGKTSTYKVIADQIGRNFDGTHEDVVKMISGERVDVDTGMYMNTMTDFESKDDVFAYLIHIGYLAYDPEDKTTRIPNKEVRLDWESAVYLAYIFALNNYTVVREMTAGKGFADMVYIPVCGDDPALVVELKHNKSTETALTQIREKRYCEPLKHYRGRLIFVGINYDEKDKTHTCKIERFGIEQKISPNAKNH